MKVIAKIEHGIFICEVTHGEVEKFMGKYYGHLKTLEVGDEIDLGKGHDFFSDTTDALRKTKDFMESNSKTIKTILEGIKIAGVGDEK